MAAIELYPKGHCEYIRQQSKSKFEGIKGTWVEAGSWTLPHKTIILTGGTPGARNNRHIVDATHVLALRSFVAGFLEGNTSASRPWYRIGHRDAELSAFPENRAYLDTLTRRTLEVLGASNFYTAAGAFYYDFGTFNTGAYYIDERPDGSLHFHNLDPGTYYCLNNDLGVADILVREFSLTCKAMIDRYGRKKDGTPDWSNISERARKMYEDGNYAQTIDIVQVVKPNDHFDNEKPMALLNRPWISMTYELGGSKGQYYQDGQEFGFGIDPSDKRENGKYLSMKGSKRKPFIVGRSDSTGNFEYGMKGPTTDSLGIIKSLNKKAIGKDIALDQMLKPAVQGPAHLRKSYLTTAPNSFIPLDAQSAAAGGLKPVFQVNPAIAALNQDVGDLRNQVDKFYYADYLLYLTQNPKTRTATETNAVVQEQQLIIGPNLQSLNWTHNSPIVDFVVDYVLDTDPYLPDPPESLQGEFLKTEFVSVFAQAQKAADLPAIERYIAMATSVGTLKPEIWDKVNLDKLADLYEDRLFLPPGLNNPQSKVEAMRQQQAVQAQRDKAMHETLPAIAGAAKDLGLQRKQQ